ncbi:hypothetical protein Hanom_Chr08g00681721 [Helianthus anomalus]
MGVIARGPGPIQLDSAQQFPPLCKNGPSAMSAGPGPSVVISKPGPVSGLNLARDGLGLAPGNKDPNSILKNNVSSKAMIDNLREKSRGSGFFDITQNYLGPQKSTLVETKNSFDKLQDEEECFDTEYGLWEKELLLVRKFYETNTCPPFDVYSSWSDKMKAYYVILTKFDPVKDAMVETSGENEIKVESETDEAARDIARGA